MEIGAVICNRIVITKTSNLSVVLVKYAQIRSSCERAAMN